MHFTPLSIALELLIFLCVVLGVVFFSTRVEVRRILRRRLDDEKPAKEVARTGRMTLVREQGPRGPVLAWVQRATLTDPKEAGTLQRDLAMAGFDSVSAPAIYVICRFTAAAGLPIAFVLGQKFLATPITGFMLIVFALGLAVVGLILPRAFIDRRASARKTQLQHEFPDALDLMVVCVESGLGLEGSLLKVGQETRKSHPRLSMEFEQVSQELRVGRGRAEALRNMADRTGVDAVKAFVTLMIQTDSLGGSIAMALRTYSDELRKHRMLKAEEKAMRLPVLLTIPLVACILPVIFVAVLLPAIIDAIKNFMPAMASAQ